MSFSIQIEYFLTFRAGHTGLPPISHVVSDSRAFNPPSIIIIITVLYRLTNSPVAVIVYKRQTLDLRARRVLVLTHILKYVERRE